MARRRVFAIVVALAAVVVWLSVVRIGRDGGDAFFDYAIGRGIPVTFYLPDDAEGRFPPVVVAGHGYTGDRRSLHPIATALREHGFAVLTMDFRGHGASRDPFIGDLRDDVIEAMDFLERSGWVDGSKIALLGHSMGANTVIDAATIDERPDAVIGVSGGRLSGDRDPKRALLVIAETDPPGTRANARELADAIEGAEIADIRGTNHLSVIWNDETIDRSVEFLDETWDIDRGKDDGFPFVARPLAARPVGPLVPGLLAAIVVIAGIGYAAGRAVPRGESARGGPWLGLVLLAVALVVAAPIVLVAPLASFVPLDLFDDVASYLLLVAALLFWRSPVRSNMRAVVPVIRPALAAAGGIYVLTAPLLSPLHRFVPTPERAVVIVVGALLLFPFFAVVNALVRRGGLVAATIGGLVSRVLIVAAFAIGASTGFLPGVISLGVPVFVLLFLVIEVFAFSAYAAGRNALLIAAVESVWIAWLLGVQLPVTI